MTDELKDIFKEFKARAHSPLFGSFVISWLCINWYIPVALFFYKQSDLCLDGFSSYREVILANTDWRYNFLLPFIFAALYTFGYPYVRAKIKEHQTIVNTDSDNKIVVITAKLHSHEKIVKGLNEKYAVLEQLNAKTDEQIKKVEKDLSEKESLIKKTQIELTKSVTDFTNLKEELSQLLYLNSNNSLFNGLWDVSFPNASVEKRTQRWNINNNQIYLVKDMLNERIGNITSSIYFDTKASLTYTDTNTNKFVTYVFTTNHNQTLFIGSDETGQQVTFRKAKSNNPN